MVLKKQLINFLILIIFTLTALNSQSASLLQSNSTLEIKQAPLVVRVLFDKSHCGGLAVRFPPGSQSPLGGFLGEYGFYSETNLDQTMDNSMLFDGDNRKYDILVIQMPQINYTTTEKTAISDFIDDGDGVIFTGTFNKKMSYRFNNNAINELTDPYGVTFYNPVEWNDICDNTSWVNGHPFYEGVDWFLFSGSQIILDSGEASEIHVLANTTDTTPRIVEATRIYGDNDAKLVFLGTNYFMYDWKYSYDNDVDKYIGANYFQHSLNIFNWAAGAQSMTMLSGRPEIVTHSYGPGPNLTQSELDNWTMLQGCYHIHTDASDGVPTPKQRAHEAIEQYQDFLVVTDHTYGTGLDSFYSGGEIQKELKGTGITVINGTEASQGFIHATCFPIDNAMFNQSTVEQIVENTHAMGGIVFYAHPGVTAFDNIEILTRLLNGSLGIDGIETVNGGWQYGEGELVFDNDILFLGASDAHQPWHMWRTRNFLFVHNNTQAGVMDAIKNRRVVIFNPFINGLSGEDVWLNEAMKRLFETNDTVNWVATSVQRAKSSGNDVTAEEELSNETKYIMGGEQLWNARVAKEKALEAYSTLPDSAKSPLISSPADLSYVVGSTDKIITWAPETAFPSHYEIYKDGVLQENTTWSGGAISLNIDGLDAGSFDYKVIVFDTDALSTEDIVTVTVEAAEEENGKSTPAFELTIIFLAIVFVFLKRRK